MILEIVHPCRAYGVFGLREKKDRSEQMQYTVSLKLNHVFQRLYRKGKARRHTHPGPLLPPQQAGENRLGLTTGAKLGHHAVCKQAALPVEGHLPDSRVGIKPGFDIVVVCRAASVEASYRRLERDFQLACRNGRSGSGTGRAWSHMKRLLLRLLIRFYRRRISPARPTGLPVHSNLLGVRLSGGRAVWTGQRSLLAAKRLAKCQPPHRQKSIEYDPVPEVGAPPSVRAFLGRAPEKNAPWAWEPVFQEQRGAPRRRGGNQ